MMSCPPTWPLPHHDLAEAEVDLGVALQEGKEQLKGFRGKQLCHPAHKLQALSQKTLPLRLILRERERERERVREGERERE